MKNEFLEKLEERIKIARARDNEISVERIQELDELKSAMISWVQKDFICSIPPIIQTDSIIVSSDWLWAKKDGDLLNISINQSSVYFKTWAHVYAFLTEVAIELSKIADRQVYIKKEAGIQLSISDEIVETKFKFFFEYEIEEELEKRENV